MARFYLSLLFLAFVVGVQGDLVNRRVQRKINLQKHFTTIETSVTIVNTGSKPTSRIVLKPDPHHHNRLSSILVYQNGQSIWLNPEDWQAQLSEPIDPDQSVDLTIEEIYTHVTKPLPEKIKQQATQYMTYEGNLHHFSPYLTRRETVQIKLPSKDIKQYNPTDARKMGKQLEYGEYKDVAAGDEEKVFVHYEANIPYVSTHYLKREIEISHWGNVAVTDDAIVQHVGAELDGAFSRVQYSHDGGDDAANVHWVPKLTAVLPKHANNVYYRDAIGNISTSRLRTHSDRVEIELRPRTPLFGGWKSDYTLGFNIPSEKALFYSKKDNTRFTLKLKAIDELYLDQVVDQVEIQIILPESAQDISVSVPAGYERAQDRVKFTYLDITGRPVIVLRANNLAGRSLNQMLEVQYTYPKGAIIREPVMTIAFFAIIFLIVMLAVRLDFTIGDDTGSDLKARIHAAYVKAQEANNSRKSVHGEYQLAIERYRITKDLSILTDPQKKYRGAVTSFVQTLKMIDDEYNGVIKDKIDSAIKLAQPISDYIGKGESAFSKIKEADQKINEKLDN